MNRDWDESGLGNLSPDFFTDSKKLYQTGPKTKSRGGPHTKNKRLKRQNEVSRLHFEYGYSERKIAAVLNVNRKTVNQDLKTMYKSLSKNFESFNLTGMIMKHYYRQEHQRTRLREKLDKSDHLSEEIAFEKLIMEMDNKMPLLLSKVYSSHERIFENMINYWNLYAEKNNLHLRLIASREITKVSKHANDKIRKMIDDDKHSS